MTSPSPPATPAQPAWVATAFSRGPVIGALLAGFLTWLPSHSVGEFITTAVVIFVILAVLRLVDGQLDPLWTALDRVPRPLRIVAGIAIPWWYSVSQFGPDAAGKEVSTVRSTLVVTTIIAYVLFHGAPADREPGP